MPEFLDILNETYNSNVTRIAQLCEMRDKACREFEAKFARLRDLDGMLALSATYSTVTTEIDAEIIALERGSKKLLAQINIREIAAAPEPETGWWSESGLL